MEEKNRPSKFRKGVDMIAKTRYDLTGVPLRENCYLGGWEVHKEEGHGKLRQAEDKRLIVGNYSMNKSQVGRK